MPNVPNHPDQRPLFAPSERDDLAALARASWQLAPDRVRLLELDADAPDCPRTFRGAELLARADALSADLRGAGVGPGDCVALDLPRGAALLAAMVAIRGLGAAWAGLDPSWPQARKSTLCDLLGARCLVDGDGITPLRRGRPALPSSDPTSDPTSPQSLAYVVFTSGSTGTPKAAGNRVRGLQHLLARWAETPGLRPDGMTLCCSSPAFDMSVLQLWMPTLHDGVVAVIDDAIVRDGALAARALSGLPIRDLLLPPSTWRSLRSDGWRPAPGAAITFGGEALPLEVARDALDCGAEVWNGWGVSEAAACTTLARLRGGALPPSVGTPFDGAAVRICAPGATRPDAPLPLGATGEIWILGEGVGCGYLGFGEEVRAANTRFVGDAYRTGDRGRLLPDGSLHFLGRLDAQVQVRGQRVEPAEVEATLAALPGVAEAAVVAVDGPTGARLVAFFRASDGPAPTFEALRRGLAERLPAAMQPSVLRRVERMPLGAAGKTDRGALVELLAAERDDDAIATRTPTTATTTATTTAQTPEGPGLGAASDAVAAILGAAVDPDLDLAAAGLDSLGATRLAARLQQHFGRRLAVTRIWRLGTTRALAAALSTRDDEPTSQAAAAAISAAAVRPADRTTPTPTELALLHAHRLRPDDPGLRVQAELQIRWPTTAATPDFRALARALGHTAAAHPGLRRAFDPAGSCRLLPDARPELIDLADLPPARAEAVARARLAGLQLRPDAAPIALLRMPAEGQLRLRLLAHHVALDGAAVVALGEALVQALAAEQAGAAGRSRPAPQSAPGQAQSAAARAGLPPPPGTLALPGAESLWPRLCAVARQARATPQMALLGLVAAYRAQRHGDGRLCTVYDPRGDEAFAGGLASGEAIAHRAETIVVRTETAAEATALDAIEAGRRALIDAVEHRRAPTAEELGAGILLQDAPDPVQHDGWTLDLALAPAGPVFAFGLEWAAQQGERRLWLSGHGETDALRSEGAALLAWLDEALRRPAVRLPDARHEDLRTLQRLLSTERPGGLREAHVLATATGPRAFVVGDVEATARALATNDDAPRPAGLRLLGVSSLPRDLRGAVDEAALRALIAPPGNASASTTEAPFTDASTADPSGAPTAEPSADAIVVAEGPPLQWPDDAPMTLPALLHRAAAAGAQLAFESGPAEPASRLLAEAEALAARLRHDRAPIAVVAGVPREFLRGVWASWLAGRAALLLPADLAADAIRDTLEDAGAVALSSALAERDTADPATTPTAATGTAPLAADDDLALLLRTSGSTGRAKIVAHSHRTLLAQLCGWGQHEGFGPGDRFLNWLPLDHVAALVMFHLQPLWQGAAQRQLAPGPVLADPLRWLDAMAADRSTVTWAPNFAVALTVDALQRATADARWDLSALRAVLNGGEAIVPQTAARFVAALRGCGMAAHALRPGWGMSETASATVTRSEGARGDESDHDGGLMRLGQPIPGARLLLREDRLLFAGPSRFVGYLRRGADGLPTLHQPWGADGAFDTGDLARVRDDGELLLVGRGDDALVLQGVLRAAVPIEAAALATGHVAPGGVAAFAARRDGDAADGLALCYVPAGLPLPGDDARIAAAVAEATGVVPRWVVAVGPDALPRTALGKVQRPRLRAAFEAGTFDATLRPPTLHEVWRPLLPSPATLLPGPLCLLGPHDPSERDAIAAHLSRLGWQPTSIAGPYPLVALADAEGPAVVQQGPIDPQMTRLLCVDRPGSANDGIWHTLLGAAATRRGVPQLHLDFDADGGFAPSAVAAAIDDVLRRPAAGDRRHIRRGDDTWALRLASVAPLAAPCALRGRAVVLLGGAGGIGAALALRLRQEGAAVLLLGRRSRRDLGEAAERACAAGARYRQATTPTVARQRTASFERTHGPIAAIVQLAAAAGPAAYAARVGSQATLAALLAERPQTALVDVNSVLARLIPGLSPDAPMLAYATAAAAGLRHTLAERARRPTTALLLPQVRGCGLSAGRDDDPLAARAGLPPIEVELAVEAIVEALQRPGGTRWIGVDPAGVEIAPLCEAPPRLRADVAVHGRVAKLEAPAPPLRPLQTKLAALWREVLGREIPPGDPGFFAAGGDSLALTRLAARLEDAFALPVRPADLVEHATLTAQARWLAERTRNSDADTDADADRSADAQRTAASRASTSGALAIVGVAGRFAGAEDVTAFWRAICGGESLAQRFGRATLQGAGLPDAVIDDPAFVPVRAPLAAPTAFDAAHFAIPPREAGLTDPQHRVFLEVAAHALDDAAIAPDRFSGAIGVFAGAAPNTWLLNAVLPGGSDGGVGAMAAVVASDKDHLATRVAYKLGLRGPAVAVQSACSTSLVAVHLAARALRAGDCDAAIAGGASIAFPTLGGHAWQQGGIASRDGETRSFAEGADGTISADAVAAVVLRRLDDALADGDPIRAVLLGSASNNDGAERLGYTAPSADGQRAVIAAALADAGVDPADVALIEGHGTATPLGDPTELGALERALGPQPADRPKVRIGSAKSNLGHSNTAAGAVGLIKATLAVQRGVIPPSRHLDAPTPALAQSERLAPAAALTRWPEAAGRLAGVSSFGAGGTNAHVVIGPPPERERATRPDAAASAIVLLQGDGAAAIDRTRQALLAALQAPDDALALPPDLCAADVATTLWRGRRRQLEAAAYVLPADADASALVQALAGPPHAVGRRTARGRVCFLLPGQGFQKLGTGAVAYREDAAFRAAFDRVADATVAAGGSDLRRFLAVPQETTAAEALQAELDDQRQAGAFTLATSWAMAAQWQARGVRPDVVLGQSTGELCAAALTGVLSIEDAVRLTMARAELLDRTEPGAVLAVALGAEALEPALPAGAWVALRNGPEATVCAGRPAAIAELQVAMRARGVVTREVRVSIAAHTPLLEPVAAPLTAFAAALPLQPPSAVLWSCVTGRPLDADAARDPLHWARLTIAPVDLQRALQALDDDGDAAWIELGPAGCLRAPVRWNAPGRALVASDPQPDLAHLCCLGGAEAEALAPAGGRRVHLPGVAFARTVHDVRGGMARAPLLSMGADGVAGQPGAAKARSEGATTTPGRSPRPALPIAYRTPRTPAEQAVVALVEELLGIDGVGADDDFFALGGDSLVTMRLVEAVRRRHAVELPPSAAFGGLTAARLARYFPADAGAMAMPMAPGDALPSCLVPLRMTGDDAPLFFVHPAAGVVFPYFELARALPASRPFWALQAVGLGGEEEPDPDVRAMARRYIAAMRQIQPRGPYHVGAYSFGCYVAFEMARQLEAVGERVATLGLVDEAAPLDGHRPTPAMMSRIIFGRAGRTLAHHLHDYLFLRDRGRRQRKGGRSLPQLIGGRGDRVLERLLQRSAMAALLPEEAHGVALDQPAMAPLFALLRLHLRETLGYTPDGAITAGAVLFRSSWVDDRPRWMRVDPDPTYGWSQLCRGGVDIVPVPGDHLAVIRQPHVRVLAERLEAAMRQEEGKNADGAPRP